MCKVLHVPVKDDIIESDHNSVISVEQIGHEVYYEVIGVHGWRHPHCPAEGGVVRVVRLSEGTWHEATIVGHGESDQ